MINYNIATVFQAQTPVDSAQNLTHPFGPAFLLLRHNVHITPPLFPSPHCSSFPRLWLPNQIVDAVCRTRRRWWP